MRRIRYQVAASLDRYIAGPNGEADWIIMDPDIDFAALFNQFDTIALDSGFADQSHFTSVFRRMLGVTPSEYRRLIGTR